MKKAISSLKKKAWPLFSQYIRMRDCLRTTGSLDYGECITCDNQFEFNQLQAGHFIPGRHNSNLFSEKGCHAQCVSCNRYHGGQPLEYRRQIIKLYGEGADLELEEEARKVKKFTLQELETLIVDLREKIKELNND